MSASFLVEAQWCAPFLDPSLASARNDHHEHALPTEMPSSPAFHYVLGIISYVVAELLPKLRNSLLLWEGSYII
jgi:hypothetical protein